MRIVFLSNVNFGVDVLSTLKLKNTITIAGIITTKSDIYKNSDFSDLSKALKQTHVPVHYTTDINAKETIDWLSSVSCDLLVCVGWSRILGKNILSIPKFGVIGYHPSLLPKNAGRHPIIWAIALGLRWTGSSFFMMDELIDHGHIISQRRVRIPRKYKARDLYARLVKVASLQLKDLLSDFNWSESNNLKVSKKSNGNTWRKRSIGDGQIDWRMNSNSIVNLSKALSAPYGSASFVYNGQEYRVLEIKKAKCLAKNVEPGKVIKNDGGSFIVKCGKGAVRIIMTEPGLVARRGDYLL